jgi:hypothetical protein
MSKEEINLIKKLVSSKDIKAFEANNRYVSITFNSGITLDFSIELNKFDGSHILEVREI